MNMGIAMVLEAVSEFEIKYFGCFFYFADVEIYV